ncbi:MAG: ATP-binding response regulator [Candidatus Binataceae bacterium]
MSAAENIPATMEFRDGYEAALAALSKAAVADAEPGATFALAARLIIETLTVEASVIYELAETSGTLLVRAAAGWRNAHNAAIAIEPDSLAARALMSDSALVEDLTSASDVAIRAHGFVGGAAIALRGVAGPLGVLSVYSKRTLKLDLSALAFLKVTASLLALTFERFKLIGARDRALEASRLKSALIGNVSHEIRTPLNIILGYSELLGDYLTEKGDLSQSAYLDAVRRASQRLLGTVDEVLDYSHIDVDGFQPLPVLIEIAPVLDHAIAAIAPLAEANRLELPRIVEAAASTVHFDSRCLSGALAHLLKTAVKISRHGRVIIRLDNETSGALCLSIGIDGVGIHSDGSAHPSSSLAHDDGNYFRHFEGAALSLALARKYLELGGATLLVTDEQNRRTIFTIRFDNEDRKRTPMPDAFPVFSNPWAPRRGHILVVEDDAETQSYIHAVLGGHYDLSAAASAEAAREVLARSSIGPDLILMDLSLEGGEDGLTLVRALRADWRWQSTPIVALTAFAAPEDRARALGAGCDAHFAKPVERRALLATIARLTRTLG